MDNFLKIGIRNNNSDRVKIVHQIFEIVKKKIKDKKCIDFSIEIGDYELLKNQFENYDKNMISYIETNKMKALTKFTKNIILFSDIFFDISQIEQESVFIHEIGHIANKPESINNDNDIINTYFEYRADRFLFEVDYHVFGIGRIESDLKIISIEEINNNIEKSDNKEGTIKAQFVTLTRLYYYYTLYKFKVIDKINSLTNNIKIYFLNTDNILKDLELFCNGFSNKSEQELYSLSDELDNKIINLRLRKDIV